MGCAKVIAEPSRGLKLNHSFKAFRTRRGGALPPNLGSILAVPGRRVDQPKTAHSRRIQSGKRLSDASSHRAACDTGSWPSYVVEQFRKITREQFRRESFSAPTGFCMSAAIVGQNRGLTGQSRRNTVPDAAIERQRMDQYDSWRVRVPRRSQSKRDGAAVRRFENFFPYDGLHCDCSQTALKYGSRGVKGTFHAS